MKPQQQDSICYQSCIESGQTATEAIWIWSRSIADIDNKIVLTQGKELIEQALKDGRGVLLTGPHIGNWEIITFWCGQHFPTTAMYRAPKLIELDALIRKGREKTGTQLVTGESKHIKHFLRQLKHGKLCAILSDQEPKKGSGLYAPFFGQAAYTQTLIHKLLQRTHAELLMIATKRVVSGFELSVSKPLDIDKDLDAETFATQLNLNLQKIIENNMAQYEWGYKRFKSPPDGDYDFYV